MSDEARIDVSDSEVVQNGDGAAPEERAVEPAAAPLPELDDPSLFVNRELSWLEFNQRVLDEAEDPTQPLLERLKFLSIVDSNLHEFFMVRVAGLKQQIAAGVVDTPADGMTPAEQLAAVRRGSLAMFKEQHATYQAVLPELAAAGIHILDYDELSEKQKASAESTFNDLIFPILTPLAFDFGRPFPFISNLSLNLAVVLRDHDGNDCFARIKVPDSLPSLLPLKRSSGGLRKDGTVPHNHYFVWLEEVIMANLDVLFPGMEIVEAFPFHVVRDADLDIQELEAADLLAMIEHTVQQRRFGSVVRLTINPKMPERIRSLLMREMQVDKNDVYAVKGPLRLSGLMALHGIERHDLKDAPLKPARPPELPADGTTTIFDTIRSTDVFLHHPFDSFTPVIEFLEEAARDPQVLAIKMTLYRVGRASPVVAALLEALQNGKQVSVLVELKARFDEESNIGWAKRLEKAGVHVVYGLMGLKTHSKATMVVRREGEAIRRYIHLATGNYNHITAKLYTDMGMFTVDPDIGDDVTHLFNYLTGYSDKVDYKQLMVAPLTFRNGFKKLIDREIGHQRAGKQGRLIFKMNSLVDKRVIRKLYEASQAGVEIELLVRGICCLRPGIPGISDNIRVRSIVGRFLEHSRIYYFGNAGEGEVYLASADLMPRNIDHRVEVVFPVTAPHLVHHLRDVVLKTYLRDNVKARLMHADGSYAKIEPADGEKPVSSQLALAKARTLDTE